MFDRWLRRGSGAETKADGAAGEAADTAEPGAAAALERSLARTRHGLWGRLASVFTASDIEDATWEELEAQLIGSDVGAAAAADLVAATRRAARAAGVRRACDLPAVLQTVVVELLDDARPSRASAPPMPPRPYVVLVVGVNGSGKTTTIAKLAAWHARSGRSVLLVAADTFRAAAVEQLAAWGARIGVPVIAGHQGGDPGAVVYDALGSAEGRSADVVIVDTAGRLHTQRNLMSELAKIRNVVQRLVPGAPHETLLVLDATTGQNGLAQARAFAAAVDVSGIALAKLDSSARGGVALAVTRELAVPILYVGTGEAAGDLAPFDAQAYAAGLLGHADAGVPANGGG